MRVGASGLFFDARSAPINQQSVSSTAVVRTADDTLLVTCRLGSDREGPDGHAALFASRDLGASWELRYMGLADREWDGIRGEARAWMISEPAPGELRASVLWVDRSDPDAPWVNQRTLGLRPMRTYHLTSRDGGWTWSDRRRFDTAPYPGASATGPLVRLADGRLGQPFEHWKEYEDPSPGRPAALLRISADGGLTWPDESVVARDRENRVFYWDQRLAVHPGTGQLVAMFWTHDVQAGSDLDVHVAWGSADGRTWSRPLPTGLAGQHCQPVAIGGDRLVAVYSHRRHPPGIRAALSRDFGRTWDASAEARIYDSPAGEEPGSGGPRAQEDYWNDMGAWQFGHPRGVATADGHVFAVFYGGRGQSRSGRWALIEVDG
jgi:hypothetical protein